MDHAESHFNFGFFFVRYCLGLCQVLSLLRGLLGFLLLVYRSKSGEHLGFEILRSGLWLRLALVLLVLGQTLEEGFVLLKDVLTMLAKHRQRSSLALLVLFQNLRNFLVMSYNFI